MESNKKNWDQFYGKVRISHKNSNQPKAFLGFGPIESDKKIVNHGAIHYIPGKMLIIWYILSTVWTGIGCAIHIWYISEIYFAYATTTSILIRTEMEPALPSITLCMYLRNTFNQSKFLERMGRSKGMFDPIPPDLTIGEINELGINMDEIVEEVQVQLFGYPARDLNFDPTFKSLHVGRDLKCVTLFRSANDSCRIRVSRGSLLRFKLRYFDASFVEHYAYERLYRLYVHAFNTNIGEVLFGTSFEIKAGNTLIVKYSTSHSVLLPPPYDTNCRDYTKNPEFRNRADCIEACQIRNTLKSGQWPREVGIDLGNSKFNWSTLYLSPAANNTGQPNHNRESVTKDCQDKECKEEDCVKNHTSLSLVVDKVEADSPDSATLFVWLPTEPSTTFLHNPKMEPVEYVCYLGSVVSLWFGLSVITSLLKLNKVWANVRGLLSEFAKKEQDSHTG